MSVYQDAGLLILGTRLKRISDRFLNEVSRIYLKQNICFETAWFPVLFLLDKKGSLSLTEISNELEVSHSAISQMMNQLQAKNIVDIQPDDSDARIKRIFLTVRGKKLIEQVHPVWNALDRNLHRILPQNMDHDEFLNVLSFIEKQLNHHLLSEATLTYLNHQPDDVKVIEPDNQTIEKLTKWLKKENAGFVLSEEKLLLALTGDDIIGMAAFQIESDSLILNYLYVSPGQRRKGVGLRLIQHIHQNYSQEFSGCFRLNEANLDLIRVLIKSGYSFKVK